MKKLSIILLVFLLTISINKLSAQSDKNEKTNITQFRLPLAPLPKDYSTYEIKSITLDSRKGTVTSRLGIGGLTQKIGGADVAIEFEEVPFKTASVDAQTNVTEVTNKGIKSKVTTYYARVRYKHPINFRIVDKTGKVLVNQVFVDDGYKEFNTREYNSYKEMSDNYKSDISAREQDEFNNAINSASITIDNNYSYGKYTWYILICSVKPKKFNYDNFNKATAMALKGLHQIDSLNKKVTNLKDNDFSTYSDEYKPTLQMFRDAIALWQEELKESDMNNRKARIDKDLTYDLYLNLTVAYIALREFDNARKNLDEALKIRGTWANVYNGDLKELKTRFHANYPDKF
jgi:tetratricopeptide (TPR) repeat protein